MEYFKDYIKMGRPLPYENEEEAVREILALCDASCYALFSIRELWEESLEMRGVVITPRECEAALLPAEEEKQNETGEREKMGQELKEMFTFLCERARLSFEAGREIRIWQLPRTLALEPLETFSLFLTAAVEWDRKYERIYGYLQDNVSAKYPTMGFALSLSGFVFGESKMTEFFPPDSPLFHRILKRDRGNLKESRLSLPFVLNDTVWSYINTGTWLTGNWREIVSIRKEAEGESLLVSMRNLEQLRKEEGRSQQSMAGELMAAADGLGISRIILKISFGEENREEIQQSSLCLEQLFTEAHFAAERITETDKGGLGIFCSPVKTVYQWDDLILEEESKKMLRKICDQVNYQEIVKKEWGFGKKDPYGNGISALFFGPPGTGKTMAAQVIAGELGKELYKADLSRIVSKYIGETEKQLSSLFEAARQRNAVLFFDEADGLFAKRTEVSGSNDRFANMETGFLLQKLEEYDGISILATNYVNNIDEAFKRRIRFLIRFPFPSRDERSQLWKQMFPKEALLEEEIQFDNLASRFELSGSGIREVALSAAYIAASLGRGIKNEDLLNALKTHYAKYGKHLSPEELNL